MQVLFSPSLGETVYVSISDSRIPSDAVVLQFRANLGREDHEKIRRGSARVQLWSNLPVANGQVDSSWKELDFEIAEPSDKHTPSHSEDERSHTVYSLSLSNFSQESASERPSASAVEQLRLQVPVDLSRFSGEQRFAFTYRVVYADGGITWLGPHGHDGFIVLTGSPIAGTELVGGGWKGIGDGSGGGLINTLSDARSDQPIARLSNSAEYQFWAFDKNLYLRSSSSLAISDAQILIMVPRIQGLRYYNEPAYVICASQGAVLRASPSTGIVSGKGSGTVIFRSCFDTSRHLESLLQSAIAHANLVERVRSVNPKDKAWLLLLSPSDQAPTQGLLIPKRSATSFAHARKYTLSAQTLAEMAASTSTSTGEGVSQQFCVFSPSTYDLEFIDTRSHDEDSVAEVSFSVPSSGGEFRLSRVYDLTLGPREARSTKIAVLTPYTSVSEGKDEAEERPIILPTPPPSPQLHKRLPRKNVVTFSPEPTIITEDSDAEGALPSTPPPGPDPCEQEDRAISVNVNRAPPTSRTVGRRHGIFGLIKLFYSLFTSYFGFLFNMVFLGPLTRGESRADLLSRFRNRKNVEVDTAPRPELAASPTHGDGKEHGEAEEEEAKHVEDERASTTSDTVVDSDLDESPHEDDPDKPSDAVNEGTGTIQTGIDASTSLSQPSHLVVELSQNLEPESGGKVWARLVMFTTPSEGNSPHDVVRPYGAIPLSGLGKRITVDGEPSNQVIVRWLRDGPEGGDGSSYYLVELTIAGGGSAGHKTVVKIMQNIA